MRAFYLSIYLSIYPSIIYQSINRTTICLSIIYLYFSIMYLYFSVYIYNLLSIRPSVNLSSMYLSFIFYVFIYESKISYLSIYPSISGHLSTIHQSLIYYLPNLFIIYLPT